MKRIIKKYAPLWVSALLIGAGSLHSCVDDIRFGDSFLEKAPGVDITLDTIFNNANNATTFLWSVYAGMRHPYMDESRIAQTPIESLTDVAHSYTDWHQGNLQFYSGIASEANQVGGGFARFRFIPGSAGDAGQMGIWPIIRKGWIFIENVDRVPNMSDEVKSQLKGEVYTIMASRYFDALRFFGGLPLVDHAYLPSETELPARATVAATVEFIDGLLQKAIDEPGMPWRIEDANTWAGRVSKSGAYGIRAKLWQFAASPLFNDPQPYMAGGENPEHTWLNGAGTDYWNKCLAACEAFFNENAANGNWYQMIQPAGSDTKAYREAFRAGYWYRGNSEKIIEVHTSYNNGVWNTHGSVGYNYIWSSNDPSLELMEMFPMADGRNYLYKDIYDIFEDASDDAVKNNPTNIDIFANRDPRLYETLFGPDEHPLGQMLGFMPTAQLWKGGEMQMYQWAKSTQYNTGMGLYKFVRENPEAFYEPHNFAYLRVADMILTYAEALAETGNLPKAVQELNKVRARVGLPGIEVANPGLNLTSNKEAFIAELMRERACELSYEDSRYFDLVRRKMIDKFTSPVHELVTWRKTIDGKKDERDDTSLQAGESWPDFIYQKKEVSVGKRVWWSGGWSNKWLLEPLPRTEINKGYGLTQNPGW